MTTRRHNPPPVGPPADAAPAPVDRETVLIVDEDDSMRASTRTLLLAGGYAVIQAASGGEALRISRRHRGRIDLLLTDVVMPNMDGPELASRFSKLRAETRVLFMSGFTPKPLGPSQVWDDDMRLLVKPFSADELTRQVRAAIDGDPFEAQAP